MQTGHVGAHTSRVYRGEVGATLQSGQHGSPCLLIQDGRAYVLFLKLGILAALVLPDSVSDPHGEGHDQRHDAHDHQHQVNDRCYEGVGQREEIGPRGRGCSR